MITVNGQSIPLEQPLTVAEFLEQRHYQANRIAVELNGTIVPKSDYAAVMINDNDTLEVVSFVGGG